MAHTINLAVARRETLGKAVKRLRRQGLLPGVLYGYNVREPLPVQVNQREFERAYHRAGANALIDLHIGDGGPATRVFIHRLARDPVHHNLIHVDFMAVNLTQLMTADIPIVLTGEAPAVKTDDGVVLQMLNMLHVRALPANLPGEIPVDISGLTEIGQ